MAAKSWAELKAARERRTGQRLEDAPGYWRTMVSLTTGEAIRAARLEAGLTQEALAEKMGTSQPQIARLEAGQTSAKVETLARVVDATGIPLVLVPAHRGEVWVSAATSDNVVIDLREPETVLDLRPAKPAPAPAGSGPAATPPSLRSRSANVHGESQKAPGRRVVS